MDDRKRFDKRLMDRNYKPNDKGVMDYLAALPDETANAQWVEVELHDTELGGDDLDNHGSESGTP